MLEFKSIVQMVNLLEVLRIHLIERSSWMFIQRIIIVIWLFVYLPLNSMKNGFIVFDSFSIKNSIPTFFLYFFFT